MSRIEKYIIRMNHNKFAICNLQFAISCLLTLVSCFYTFSSSAQQEKKLVLEGNKHYKKENYNEAEKNYARALNKNKDSYKAAFNLGNAFYQQGKYEEAAEQFQLLTHRATSKDTLAKAYHNLGNALMKLKKYEEGANAYKNALKNNPNDEETRYNLAYAQQMLKQQQKQDKENKDKKDDKENKDKQDEPKEDDKDKNKKEKDKKEQEEKDKKESENKEEEKPKKEEISKEDAQRLLDALQNDEKNLQDKHKKGKTGVKIQIEKDW